MSEIAQPLYLPFKHTSLAEWRQWLVDFHVDPVLSPYLTSQWAILEDMNSTTHDHMNLPTFLSFRYQKEDDSVNKLILQIVAQAASHLKLNYQLLPLTCKLL